MASRGRIGLGDARADVADKWANRYELTLARDFVEHLDTLPEGETAAFCSRWTGTDAASEAMAAELSNGPQNEDRAGPGWPSNGIPTASRTPGRRGPGRMSATRRRCWSSSSDGDSAKVGPVRQVHVPVMQDKGKLDVGPICRWAGGGNAQPAGPVQLSKGVKDKGKMHYQLRIDNASPLVLNGLAALGTASKPDETPKVLLGSAYRRAGAMTVPASEEVVKTLGLKKGIKLVALDLSGSVKRSGRLGSGQPP